MVAPPRLTKDLEALRADGYTIDVVEHGPRFLIILRDFKLPEGNYRPSMVDLMVMTDCQYPLSAMDMFWTTPGVTLASGSCPQNANQIERYGQRDWQRWSWHYPGWNPSIHSVRTHLEVVKDRLARGA
jgi:hypothetical protein